MKIIPLIVLAFLSVQTILAQTGPAGVSSGLVIHLDAANITGLSNGDRITNWPDASGAGNHAQGGRIVSPTDAQRPTYVGSNTNLNNRPAVRFNNVSGGISAGNGNILSIPDAPSVRDLNALEVIFIHRTFSELTSGGSAATGFIRKREGQNSPVSFCFFTFLGNQHFADINAQSNRRSTSNFALQTNTNYILTYTFEQNTIDTDRLRIYNSGSLATISGTLPNAPISNQNQPITIGDLDQTRAGFYRGDMAEILFYNRRLNNAERAVVLNHLAAKYQINLLGLEFFTHKAIHSENVIGIGNFSGDILTSNKALNALEVSATAALPANASVFWGETPTAFSTLNSSDINTTVVNTLESRLAKTWRFDVRNYTEPVNLTFTLPAGTPNLDRQLYLLVRRGAASFAASTVEPIPVTLSGNEVVLTNFALQNGDEITIGFDTGAPLPVELLFLKGTMLDKQKGTAEVFWKTASEINNDFFEVQTSIEGEFFTTAQVVPGNGTVSSPNEYRVTLAHIFQDTYVRLVQVDFDGTTAIYGPILISNAKDNAVSGSFKVIENPVNNGILRLLIQQPQPLERFQITDLSGRIVQTELIQSERSNSESVIEIKLSNQLKGNQYYVISRITQLVEPSAERFMIR
ncbi:MAG: hypothetical protein ACXITV_03965 [Luteibaculaceae bacterium]